MTLKKNLCLIAIVLGVIAGACARQKDSGESTVSPRESPEKKETSTSPKDKARDREKRLSEELYDEIGAIEEFTPELFVRITVLYRSESARWIAESSSLPDAEQQRYIDEENIRFFGRFGTTEDEYIRYSTEHWEELDSYIEAHPELMSDLKRE
jgi:hypothetical protein